jgi:hypothetical protein
MLQSTNSLDMHDYATFLKGGIIMKIEIGGGVTLGGSTLG